MPLKWHDHPPRVIALRDDLATARAATLSVETATEPLHVPLPLFRSAWPADVGDRMAPLLERAFHILGFLDRG